MRSSTKLRPLSLADRLLVEAGEGEITAEEQASAAEASFSPVPRALLVPIERIAPSRDNPRKSFSGLDELAESIAERGVLQPLVVRRDAERPGYYITVAGARRLLAALIVRGSDDPQSRTRVAVLPCVVMDETDHDAFADALAENLAREDLSRGEVMDALLRLQNDYGWSARYIARRIGRSKSDVIELLGIAKDESVAPLVRDELITATTAGQIRRLPKQLRSQAVEGVRTGELKTAEDVRRLRREEQAPQSADSSEGVRPTLPPPVEPNSVTDIGQLAPVVEPRLPVESVCPQLTPIAVRTEPMSPEAVVAAGDVVRSIKVLVHIDLSVDAPTLRSLRAACDMLSEYIVQSERALPDQSQ